MATVNANHEHTLLIGEAAELTNVKTKQSLEYSCDQEAREE